MKEIKLTQGKFTQVDDSVFDLVNQFRWYAAKSRNTFYAQSHIFQHGKWEVIKMHRLIMETPNHLQVDHIDHNGLNNQKANLRNCISKENNWNSRPYSKSKFKGVYYTSSTIKGKRYEYISASIRINKENISLGNHKTEESAARAYDKAAKQYFGDFAFLNFKP